MFAGPRWGCSVDFPECPKKEHHGLVVKAGLYGPKSRPAHGRPARPSGPQRQLWWCYPNADAHQRPRNKVGAHRFAEKLPRRLLPATAAGHRCLECATELERHEGPPHVRGYEFPARNVAAALIAVGNGSSYFRASRTARTSNGRQQQAKLKPKSLGANGTLAGDWVGMFAPIVCGPVLDSEQWPDVVAFDEQPFIGSRKRQRKQSSKQETSWAIFGAFANPGDSHSGYLFRLHASPKIDALHAADWLRSIPGRPRVVVCDGTGVWPKAVAMVWPEVVDPVTGVVLEATPRMARCEYHLRRTLWSQLRATGVVEPRPQPSFAGQPTLPGLPWPANTVTVHQRRVATISGAGAGWKPKVAGSHPSRSKLLRAGQAAGIIQLSLLANGNDHPLVKAVGTCFDSVEAWDELCDLADRWQARPLGPWLAHNSQLIRTQLAARDGSVPRSIGALEASLQVVRRMLNDRAHLLTNTVRTNRMLDLVTLQIRGVGEERLYAERIAAAAAKTAGAIPHQRRGVVNAPRLHT
jgi:hypothetical protein